MVAGVCCFVDVANCVAIWPHPRVSKPQALSSSWLTSAATWRDILLPYTPCFQVHGMGAEADPAGHSSRARFAKCRSRRPVRGPGADAEDKQWIWRESRAHGHPVIPFRCRSLCFALVFDGLFLLFILCPYHVFDTPQARKPPITNPKNTGPLLSSKLLVPADESTPDPQEEADLGDLVVCMPYIAAAA